MTVSRQWLRRWGWLAAIAGLAAAAVWVAVIADVAGLVSTRPTTTSAPSSRRAVSRPAVDWKPPTFTARKRERDKLVATIRAYALDDEQILKVMAAVPRHEFVPKEDASSAYDDRPLPIGYGQTISQPSLVAEMTRLLNLKSDSAVLEIGTGSGYQAAVLAHITPYVYTVEIIKPLAESAGDRLKRLGYKVVNVRHGDGYYGWPEEMEFDGIIVTAAAGHIPPPLIKQLATGGRMVIPIGRPFSTQSLMLVEKLADGKLSITRLMPVAFVPFVREDRSVR